MSRVLDRLRERRNIDGLIGRGLVIAGCHDQKLRYLAPVYIGDTLHVEVAFIEKKPVKDGSRSIITYKFLTVNQDGQPVLEAQNT